MQIKVKNVLIILEVLYASPSQHPPKGEHHVTPSMASLCLIYYLDPF